MTLDNNNELAGGGDKNDTSTSILGETFRLEGNAEILEIEHDDDSPPARPNSVVSSINNFRPGRISGLDRIEEKEGNYYDENKIYQGVTEVN